MVLDIIVLYCRVCRPYLVLYPDLVVIAKTCCVTIIRLGLLISMNYMEWYIYEHGGAQSLDTFSM